MAYAARISVTLALLSFACGVSAVEELPASFIGTYVGGSRLCEGSRLVLTAKTVSWHDCKSAKFTVLEAQDEAVTIVLEKLDRCPAAISLIRTVPQFGGYQLRSYYKEKDLQEKSPTLICSYGGPKTSLGNQK